MGSWTDTPALRSHPNAVISQNGVCIWTTTGDQKLSLRPGAPTRLASVRSVPMSHSYPFCVIMHRDEPMVQWLATET